MANFNIDYLVVGGGGGGASGYGGIDGGSGGAGGLITSWPGGSGGGSASGSPLNIPFGTPYTVTVGDGGSGAAYVSPYMGILADSGDSSVFNNITALGGGGSRGWGNTAFQSSVSSGSPTYASGGGGTYTGPASGSVSAGSGTSTSRGYSGSNGQQTLYYGGAGGGAGGPAGSGTLKTSGPGMNVSITGATISYAGGGGNPLSSPNGGGGLAATSSGTGGFGTPNTGGGGGGAYGNGPTGGTGGSGVVILRYTTNTIDSYTTTGITPTEDTTTVPGQTILSFTTVGTGTITFTAPPPTSFDGTKVTNPVTGFNKTGTSEGLKLPSGTNANQPTGVQGMIRNDTEVTVDSSASAITHYNGTNWQYFAATESSDYPTSLKMYLDASDTTSYPGSGTVWTDLTGNGNNAALTNMTSANWNSGGYFTLDGSNEYFAIGSNAFQSTTPITACGWVYVSDFTSFRSIFSLRALANQSVKMIVAINTDKTIRLDSASTSNFVTLGVSSVANGIPSGQWVHVAAIIDYGTKEYKLYKNKTLAITGTNSSIRNGSDFSVNTFQLGANYSNQYFKGNISKFRVYDKVLSQAEIDALVDEGR